MVRIYPKYWINKITGSLISISFICAGFYQVSQATTVSIQPHSEFDLNCIERNLSGVTYNKDTDSLFMVTNEPVALFQISIKGDCLNSYPLDGFDDVEDIVYIGNNQYLLVEERRHRVSLIEPKETTTGVNIVIHHSFQIAKKNKPNKGLEGIAYHEVNNEIFLASEFPRRIYHIKDWRENTSPQVKELSINPSLLVMGDYSAINVHHNKFLLLSDRSSRLLKLNRNGDDKQKVNLVDSNNQKLEQAEGVTMSQQNLFVVSEPNQLYVYHLDSKPAQQLGMVSHNNNFLH